MDSSRKLQAYSRCRWREYSNNECSSGKTVCSVDERSTAREEKTGRKAATIAFELLKVFSAMIESNGGCENAYLIPQNNSDMAISAL